MPRSFTALVRVPGIPGSLSLRALRREWSSEAAAVQQPYGDPKLATNTAFADNENSINSAVANIWSTIYSDKQADRRLLRSQVHCYADASALRPGLMLLRKR